MDFSWQAAFSVSQPALSKHSKAAVNSADVLFIDDVCNYRYVLFVMQSLWPVHTQSTVWTSEQLWSYALVMLSMAHANDKGN